MQSTCNTQGAQVVYSAITTTTNNSSTVPVTVLAGFLGAGESISLDCISTKHHGARTAVIENEFGKGEIDHEPVVNANQGVFETNSDCIFGTVRGCIRVGDSGDSCGGEDPCSCPWVWMVYLVSSSRLVAGRVIDYQ